MKYGISRSMRTGNYNTYALNDSQHQRRWVGVTSTNWGARRIARRDAKRWNYETVEFVPLVNA